MTASAAMMSDSAVRSAEAVAGSGTGIDWLYRRCGLKPGVRGTEKAL